MTITHERAKTLLDGATPRPWRPDGNGVVRDIPRDEDLMTSDDIADCREADAPLIAAAPDLARTVIDQAEEIAKLRGMISRASCEIDALKNPGIDQ